MQFSIANVISSKRHFPSSARDLLTAFPPCFLPCLLIFSCPSSFAGEKGASSWLSSTLSLECHGFALQKGDFCDVIALRYGWSPQNLPSNCVFGKSNTIEHALSCPNGAFPTIRHNDIRDLMAELMSEVCHDVSKEPSLQAESLSLHTCNLDNGAWLDIKACSFWDQIFQDLLNESARPTLPIHSLWWIHSLGGKWNGWPSPVELGKMTGLWQFLIKISNRMINQGSLQSK